MHGRLRLMLMLLLAWLGLSSIHLRLYVCANASWADIDSMAYHCSTYRPY